MEKKAKSARLEIQVILGQPVNQDPEEYKEYPVEMDCPV
jgi:hypothetical protein